MFPNAEPAPGLLVASHLRTAAGSPLPVEVTLTNNATSPRVLAVGALGVDSAWLPAPIRTAVLEPGQSVMVTLEMSPAQGTVPAHYPFAFTVQALDPATGRSTGGGAVMVDSTLVVNPRNQLTLELRPRSLSTVNSRRMKLALRNSGNEPARVTLGVQTSPRLRVRFRKKVVEVLPGATELVRGRATVSRRRLFGGSEHHTFTVSASGTESLRHVDGSVTQHPLVGTVLMKTVALLSVLAIWIGAAVIFIPNLADRIGSGSSTTTTTADGAPGGSGKDGGGDGSGSSGGSGGTAGTGGGSGGKGGAKSAAADADDSELTLTGTVAGDQPGGVRVSLEPTSLVDEKAQGGVGVGVSRSQLGSTGMSLASAFLNRSLPTTPSDRTATTTADGSWAFAKVKKPGYYLLTFSKPGFQKQSYVIDSTSDASAEPLEVDLAAGEGALSGTVVGPSGRVGAATVTISDGTTTLTTSTNSRGDIGHWSVKGLSTPGSYVVQASKPGFSSESRMVGLAAGGTATADLVLKAGVASLTGRVRSVNESGELTGVGGATVTVTSESGEVRTATTLTQGDKVAGSSARVSADFVGTYTVPGLPAPGTYVVTLTGPGMQTQTSKVTLKPGQSRAATSADLVPSTGSVSGTVTSKATSGDTDPVIGAGLTLTNADNTYKTMSTSQPAGSYLLDGVAPGTYALTTQFFGFVTDHVTVTVRAGRTTNLDRVVDELAGGVLAGRSKIQGQVVDAGTGLAITCTPAGSECLTARVFEPDIDTDGATADPSGAGGVTYPTTFLPGDTFTLPEDTSTGLLPGLHTVEVTAPSYELATTRVQVPADGTVNIGTLGLYPAPKVTGTITSVVGTPSGPTCIWVVPTGDDEPSETCTQATTGADPTCTPTSGTFALDSTEPQPVCAFVNGRGTYSVEVLKHGSYTVYVKPSDPEYEAADPAVKVLGVGDTQNFSVPLHRKGRLTVTVRKPGTSGNLVPATLVPVRLDPGTPTDTTDDIVGTTDGTGRVSLTKIKDATYTISATDSAGLKDSRSGVFIGLDQDIAVDLTLTLPIGNVVGQVTANIDGTAKKIDGASVKVVAPSTYNTGSTVLGTAEMTTDQLGCFAIQPNPTDVTTTQPSAGECPSAGAWTAGSLAVQTFRSSAASSIEIDKDGYDPLLITNRQLLTSGLNAFTLNPTAIDGNSLPLLSNPTDSGISWANVTFSVDITGGGTFVSLTASPDVPAVDGHAHLNWNDSRLPAGMARPGHYKVTATLAGYESVPLGVTCDVGATSCVWDGGDPLTLVKQGSLTVSTVDAGGSVNGAQFTLFKGTTELQTVTAAASSNSVTFSGLKPNATDYKVRIRAASHAFGVAGGGAGSLPMTCDAPTPVSSRTTTNIPPGAGQSCTVTLTRLGTVTGTVKGIIAPASADPDDPDTPVRALASAEVQLTFCDNVPAGTHYCAHADTSKRFTASVNDLGQFTLTGSTSQQGIDSGNWLLTASAPGFHLPGATPSGALPGVLIEGLNGTTVSKTVNMWVDLTQVTVKVTDQVGAVSGATVRLQTPDGLTTLPNVPTETPADSGSYVFTNVVPGSYKIAVSKSGYISTASSTTFEEGTPTFTRDLGIVRGSSIASGVVAGGIKDVLVRICPDDACAADVHEDGSGAAKGTDRQPMRTKTDATGHFSFTTVPDGTWYLVFSKHGYLTQPLGSFAFSYVAAGFTNINPTLVGVTRGITLDVSPSWTSGSTDGATVTISRAGGPPISPATVTGGEATFESVPWGCWQVSVTPDTAHHHYGRASAVVDTGNGDDQVGTCTGLVLSGDEDDADRATGDVTIHEGAVAISAGKSIVPGFAGSGFPGTAKVSITRAGDDPGVTPVDVSVGSASPTLVWLPTGGNGYVVKGVPSPANAFFGSDQTTTAAVPDTEPAGGALPVSLSLDGEYATLVVTVNGHIPSDPQALLTLTSLATPLPDTSPRDYTDPVSTTGYTYTFQLPAGSWTVSATVDGRPGDDTVVIDDPVGPDAGGTYAMTVTVPLPPATSVTAGNPGAFSPTGAVKPADLAAINADSHFDLGSAAIWAKNDYVVLGNGNNAYWDGSAWQSGKSPGPPATGVTAGNPGSFTPAGSVKPTNLAAINADSHFDLGSAAIWAKNDYVVLGDGNNAYWDGSAWQSGKSPGPVTGAKDDGTFTPAASPIPFNLAALSGVTATPAAAWATGKKVVLGNGSSAYWTGTAWAAGAAP
ncbi:MULTISPECIES: carboxypeptidase-like regulatory domain-containing protein [unclassified Nocardioides]|uniref:carboxypeptidase-like regulatory domain-containing protein n=1 Tax=unclassified Nocardioides TaxID=2615069 RepID=UPI000A543004|nr:MULTISPECIES: carboxypeptidase-like regulatory domain-containing protein [unclassified Nocardioides]